jgi:protein CpxP
MKKQLCLLAVSALIGVGSAMATPQDQNSAPPPAGEHGQRHQMDPSRQVKMLAKRLNLTEDQQKQLLPILTDQQQQFEAIHNDSSLAPKDRHEKMQSVRESAQTKIKAILTDSQKQTYDQMQQQMRERMQQRRNQGQDSNSGSGTN